MADRCASCGAAAQWLVDERPRCAARPCMVGALYMQPDVVMPFLDRDTLGIVRPASADLAPLGLDNVPAAADTADMLVSLWRADVRVRADVLAAMRTAVLRILGERQYSAAHYAEFVRDCRQQVRATRALRLRFGHTGRAVDAAYLALTLATLYVAWLGEQRRMVHAHVQTVDMLVTLSLGAADATAVQTEFYAELN